MKLVIEPGTVEIRESAFAGREDIESLSLPDTLLRIGPEAFSGCSGLKELILPPTLCEIGPEAFSGCTGLKELVCPPSLCEIGAAAFMDCTALRRAILSEAQTEISAGCFLNCAALKTLRFSCGLASVGELALQGTALESFKAPVSLKYIGEQAFFDCARLREINIPNPDCVIEKDAFGSCYELTRGYVASGYCGQTDPVSVLLYTILALSCYKRHTEAVLTRADAFAKNNEALMMEWVIAHDNAAVMTGLMERGLISPENIPRYVAAASEKSCTEITALLLRSAGESNPDAEFEL